MLGYTAFFAEITFYAVVSFMVILLIGYMVSIWIHGIQ